MRKRLAELEDISRRGIAGLERDLREATLRGDGGLLYDHENCIEELEAELDEEIEKNKVLTAKLEEEMEKNRILTLKLETKRIMATPIAIKIPRQRFSGSSPLYEPRSPVRSIFERAATLSPLVRSAVRSTALAKSE